MLSATCDYYSPASRVNQSQREFPAALLLENRTCSISSRNIAQVQILLLLP